MGGIHGNESKVEQETSLQVYVCMYHQRMSPKTLRNVREMVCESYFSRFMSREMSS